MFRVTIFLVCWFVGLSICRAGELLVSVDQDVAGAAAPFSAPEGLQFVITYLDEPVFHFGEGVFWPDGSSGSVDFTAANEPSFGVFSSHLTNGADQLLAILELNSEGSGNGAGNYESGWGFGNPDLAGYDLDLIRLTVHELSIEEYNDPEFGDGLIWDGSITWDFYGEPVPEPSSLACLALGALALRRAKRRGAAFR